MNHKLLFNSAVKKNVNKNFSLEYIHFYEVIAITSILFQIIDNKKFKG